MCGLFGSKKVLTDFYDPVKGFRQPHPNPEIAEQERLECQKRCIKVNGMQIIYVCSNRGRVYKHPCLLACDRFYRDRGIRAKYHGKCYYDDKIRLVTNDPEGDVDIDPYDSDYEIYDYDSRIKLPKPEGHELYPIKK